jgi:ubiquinone/menaquinone biosynthesis C-methylase UbiE
MNKANEHDELNKIKWDERAENFDDRRFNYFRMMQKRMVSLLDLDENQHLLDLGCGTGWAVRYAAKLVNERGEFYGIDISSKMIEKAKADSKDYKKVFFYQTSAEQLPFENNFFDHVICSNSFHHYFNSGKVLSEVYRVLKPNSKVYILDVTSDGIIAKMMDRSARKMEAQHVRYYSSREYRKLFGDGGFQYITAKSIDGWLIGLTIKIHIGQKIKV